MSNKIINFDDFFKKGYDKQIKLENFKSFQQPFRVIVIGPSGSGKTNAVFNLILRFQKFDKIYYIAKDIYEEKLQMLSEFLNTNSKNELKEDAPFILMDEASFNDININELDRDTQKLFVYDDVISFNKKMAKQKITNIFIRGRKLNISSIYISHRYHSIDKVIRNNITHSIFFRTTSKRDLNMFCNDMSLILDCDDLKKLVKEATSEQYSFIIIDLTVNSMEMPRHLRKNFGGFLNRVY